MVKCCVFVEFQHELGKKKQKKWKIAKKLVQYAEFLSSGDFPSLMYRIVSTVNKHKNWWKGPPLMNGGKS
jgi:hypothetical protein